MPRPVTFFVTVLTFWSTLAAALPDGIHGRLYYENDSDFLVKEYSDCRYTKNYYEFIRDSAAAKALDNQHALQPPQDCSFRFPARLYPKGYNTSGIIRVSTFQNDETILESADCSLLEQQLPYFRKLLERYREWDSAKFSRVRVERNGDLCHLNVTTLLPAKMRALQWRTYEPGNCLGTSLHLAGVINDVKHVQSGEMQTLLDRACRPRIGAPQPGDVIAIRDAKATFKISDEQLSRLRKTPRFEEKTKEDFMQLYSHSFIFISPDLEFEKVDLGPHIPAGLVNTVRVFEYYKVPISRQYVELKDLGAAENNDDQYAVAYDCH